MTINLVRNSSNSTKYWTPEGSSAVSSLGHLSVIFPLGWRQSLHVNLWFRHRSSVGVFKDRWRVIQDAAYLRRWKRFSRSSSADSTCEACGSWTVLLKNLDCCFFGMWEMCSRRICFRDRNCYRIRIPCYSVSQSVWPSCKPLIHGISMTEWKRRGIFLEMWLILKKLIKEWHCNRIQSLCGMFRQDEHIDYKMIPGPDLSCTGKSHKMILHDTPTSIFFYPSIVI